MRYYWSVVPGDFVDRITAESVPLASFRGNQREWNETLVETILDMRNFVLRGGSKVTKIVIDEGMYEILKTSLLFNKNERQFNSSIGMPIVEMWREPIPMSEDCWAGSALFLTASGEVHRVVALHYGN